MDLETGALLGEDQPVLQKGAVLVMRSAEFDLLDIAAIPRGNLPAELAKISRDPVEVLWRSPIDEGDGSPILFPVLSENKLFVPLRFFADVTLYVLDFTTGERLWKTDNTFVSNVAVAQGKVYLLRNDARLLVFEAESGTEIGYVQFNPAETHPKSGGYSDRYWVGADNQGRVFVYFSDSMELVALAAE